jgi:hypothetical protein
LRFGRADYVATGLVLAFTVFMIVFRSRFSF